MSFNGAELGLALELEKTSERTIKQTKMIPSKNRLTSNMQTSQVFFLQDLQDLASFELKMKLFLQDTYE